MSIIVITYNSAKYVLETLESARAQTYQNIELIISDDGSKDATVQICRDWLKGNSERFVHSQLLTVEQNTGIPANCNRGVKASKGEWIKLIAGDDILDKGCIDDSLSYAEKMHCKYIISDMTYFSDDGHLDNYGNSKEIKHFFSKKTVQDKYRCFLRTSYFLNSPAHFYSREVYTINQGYDEDLFLLEDKPFILKTLASGIDLVFNPTSTVKYRINKSSSSGSFNSVLVHDIIRCNSKYVYPFLRKDSYKDLLFYFILKLKDSQFVNRQHLNFRMKLINKIYFFLRLNS